MIFNNSEFLKDPEDWLMDNPYAIGMLWILIKNELELAQVEENTMKYENLACLVTGSEDFDSIKKVGKILEKYIGNHGGPEGFIDNPPWLYSPVFTIAAAVIFTQKVLPKDHEDIYNGSRTAMRLLYEQLTDQTMNAVDEECLANFTASDGMKKAFLFFYEHDFMLQKFSQSCLTKASIHACFILIMKKKQLFNQSKMVQLLMKKHKKVIMTEAGNCRLPTIKNLIQNDTYTKIKMQNILTMDFPPLSPYLPLFRTCSHKTIHTIQLLTSKLRYSPIPLEAIQYHEIIKQHMEKLANLAFPPK